MGRITKSQIIGMSKSIVKLSNELSTKTFKKFHYEKFAKIFSKDMLDMCNIELPNITPKSLDSTYLESCISVTDGLITKLEYIHKQVKSAGEWIESIAHNAAVFGCRMSNSEYIEKIKEKLPVYFHPSFFSNIKYIGREWESYCSAYACVLNNLVNSLKKLRENLKTD